MPFYEIFRIEMASRLPGVVFLVVPSFPFRIVFDFSIFIESCFEYVFYLIVFSFVCFSYSFWYFL
jgi:hypothetical protein